MSMKNGAAQMRSIARIDRTKWLSSLSSGVRIVYIRYGTALDHAVCVNAERKLLFDNAEGFPLTLTELNPIRCAALSVQIVTYSRFVSLFIPINIVNSLIKLNSFKTRVTNVVRE